MAFPEINRIKVVVTGPLYEPIAAKADKSITITGSGLATGGGNLSANRVITVSEASQAEAENGASGSVVMTPRRAVQFLSIRRGAPNGVASLGPSGIIPSSQVPEDTSKANQTALDAEIDAREALGVVVDSKADKSITITGEGLATGSGDLSGNRTITVTKASTPQAEVGTADDVAMTPAKTTDQINARRGAADGLASLDSDIRVPDAQMPVSFGTAQDNIVNLTGPEYRDADAATAGIVARRDMRRGQPIIQDRGGAVALAVDQSGEIRVRDLWTVPVKVARDVGRAIGGIFSERGATAIAVEQSGDVRISGLIVGGKPAPREARRYVWAFGARNGSRAFGGLKSDGTFEMVPSDGTRERFYLGPSKLRGDYRLAGPVVRLPSSMTGAPVQEADHIVTFVRQRRDTLVDTALADDQGPVEALLFYGQSNAGPAGASDQIPALLPAALYPHHVVSFSYWNMFYGTDSIPPANLLDLRPAQDNVYGQSPSQMTAFAREYLNRRNWTTSPGYFVATSWYGGQPIATFQQGTQTYTNLMAIAAAAKRETARYGRDLRVSMLTYIQGESYGTYGGGTPSEVQAGYAADLNTLIDDVLPDLATQTGQSTPPVMLLLQINSQDAQSPGYTGVELAQRDVAVSRADTFLAGPMYPYPMANENPGTGANIHINNIGRMQMGEMIAVAQASVRATGDWSPLAISSITRSGAVLTVTYSPPTGFSSLALGWDAVVPNVSDGNRGFQAFRSSNGAGLTISSVAITGPWTVQITLSADPTEAVVVRYACGADAGIDTYAAGRGQLAVLTTISSVYHDRFAQPVPAFIRLFAIRDQRTSTT